MKPKPFCSVQDFTLLMNIRITLVGVYCKVMQHICTLVFLYLKLALIVLFINLGLEVIPFHPEETNSDTGPFRKECLQEKLLRRKLYFWGGFRDIISLLSTKRSLQTFMIQDQNTRLFYLIARLISTLFAESSPVSIDDIQCLALNTDYHPEVFVAQEQ